MSAIAFDWMRTGRQAKGEPPASATEGSSREEEVRLALDKSVSSCALAQGRPAEGIDKPVFTRRAGGIAAGLIGSICHPFRRHLDAIRELWLFSREVSPDWRLPSAPPPQPTLETYSRARLLKPELQRLTSVALPGASRPVNPRPATAWTPASADPLQTHSSPRRLSPPPKRYDGIPRGSGFLADS